MTPNCSQRLIDCSSCWNLPDTWLIIWLLRKLSVANGQCIAQFVVSCDISRCHLTSIHNLTIKYAADNCWPLWTREPWARLWLGGLASSPLPHCCCVVAVVVVPLVVDFPRFSLSLHDETCHMTDEFSWLTQKKKLKKKWERKRKWI